MYIFLYIDKFLAHTSHRKWNLKISMSALKEGSLFVIGTGLRMLENKPKISSWSDWITMQIEFTGSQGIYCYNYGIDCEGT